MGQQSAFLPTVSVVIPTYNRKDSLLRTLESLARQTYPADRFEVIVVDDGGTDGTEGICQSALRFSLKYVRQSHLGGTAAKNRGALESCNEFLFFLDDDITVNPYYVETLIREHQDKTRAIVMGVLYDVVPCGNEAPSLGVGEPESCECFGAAFLDCLGGFFSINRADFMSIGMLQDPAPGCWPNWEDVDLAYRAWLQGFSFFRCKGAVGYHWDRTLTSLATQCDRWRHASRAAVLLFQKHSGLQGQLPMFQDKGPIAWRQDSPALILRKLARQIASSRLVMGGMEHVVPLLERHAPHSTALRLLYRWIVSGYIYRGYREGLRALAR